MAETTSLTGRIPPAEVAAAGTGTGDDALEQAVRAHARLVYRIAHAVLRNHHDAEDATQEVFLKVLRLRRGLDGVESPKAWLARVAFRVAVDRRRKAPAASLDDESVAASVSALRSAGAGADELAASQQVQRALEHAIAALPDDLRRVLQLSTLGELSSGEIARVVGIPEGTVRTRLMRARHVLRDALEGVLGARP